MKVAFFNQAGDAKGGAEQTLLSFLTHRPPDIDAHAILFEDGKYADELRAIGVTVHIDPAPPRFLTMKRERPRLSALIPVAQATANLVRILRREKIDLLYTNSFKAHIVGSVAGRLASVPCVMYFHDHTLRLGRLLIRIVSRLGSAHRIACSQDVAIKTGAGPTTVIYGPVELDDFTSLPTRTQARAELGVDPDLPTVTILGRINRWKGHDRFLRIAKLVLAQRPAQFLVVGSPIFRDEDFLPELVSYVRAEGLEDRVHFIPWVDDVRAAYAATDVLVNCSTREPLGRTPAEAAAAGVPSVVFDDSGAAEWMAESNECRVVPAGDEAAMASAILDILATGTDEDARARLRATAAQFDPQRSANRFAEILRTYAKRRART